jgi:hypothetical protein
VTSPGRGENETPFWLACFKVIFLLLSLVFHRHTQKLHFEARFAPVRRWIRQQQNASFLFPIIAERHKLLDFLLPLTRFGETEKNNKK